MGYCRHREIEATAYRERGGFTRASASDVGEVSTQVLIHTIVESRYVVLPRRQAGRVAWVVECAEMENVAS